MNLSLYSCVFFILSMAAHAQTEWKNETSSGIVITSGNSKTQTFSVKDKTQALMQKNTVRIEGSYMSSKQNGVLAAKNWMVGLRYEREFSERFSGIFGQSIEGDSFAGILQRYNTDVGAKSYFFKEEKNFIWLGELGYRFTREHSTTETHQNFHKARLYTDLTKHLAETTVGNFWIEYIPNFTTSNAWFLNSEASIASSLTSVFSLKTAYQVRYNNAPTTAILKRTDSIFTTSLVANF